MPRKNKGRNLNRFDDLPENLVNDILSRLCVKSIGRCKTVSKSWLFITSDSDFARMQLKRSSSAAGGGIGILLKPMYSKSNKVDFYHVQEEEGCTAAGRDLQVHRLRFKSPQNSLPISIYEADCRLNNSCNGLICLSAVWEMYVCNPILGEYITIPLNRIYSSYWSSTVALGFNDHTNEYKVLRITKSYTSINDYQYAAEIHTIGTRVWRSLGQISEEYSYYPLPFNSLVHGSFHWMSDKNLTTTERIFYFNFEKEQFGSLSAPPEDCLKYAETSRLTLGVLQGNLILCAFYPSKFEMWVMKSYGVQQSWNNMLVFNESLQTMDTLSSEYSQPIMFLRDGEILLKSYGNKVNKVVRFDPAKKSVQNSRIIRSRSNGHGILTFDGISYTPSLVSLKDISHGVEVKRVRENERYEKLLAERNGSVIPLHKSQNYGGPAAEKSVHKS